jgi:hypothetical protein
VFVSRANQAAAFDRISRSNLGWRFSRRSRLSSSRSAVVRPSARRPALRSAWATQFLIDCEVGSNSRARSSGCGRRAPVRPSGDEIRAYRVVSSSTSWTPSTQMFRCPRNRVNFTPCGLYGGGFDSHFVCNPPLRVRCCVSTYLTETLIRAKRSRALEITPCGLLGGFDSHSFASALAGSPLCLEMTDGNLDPSPKDVGVFAP